MVDYKLDLVVLQKCPSYYGQNQEKQIVQNAKIIDEGGQNWDNNEQRNLFQEALDRWL